MGSKISNPRPHQEDAIRACVEGLRKAPRGQAIMACGTGKTLVGYEVAAELGARATLVLVPSLLLVQQVAAVYSSRGASRILAVCSDDVKLGEDEIRVSTDELGCESTTDAYHVGAFLAKPSPCFVICTYQSQALLDGFEFDLAIFDEAHRTAGKQGRPFSFALSDDNVKCDRRLFMTATPRHTKLEDDGETSDVFSMDDESTFGPVLYSLPMRAAIEAGIVCDYRIIVSQVRDLPNRPREVAIRAAMDKAMAKFGIRKGFTFHRRVQDAKDFITGATHTLRGVRLLHVNGNQTAKEREHALDRFRIAERAIMTNARCLTEGVDLPDADMVAFLTTKRSTIDVVQAVGRVSRKHANKRNGGFVFLPVFVSQNEGEDLEAAVKRSNFAQVLDVLQALRESDEALAAELKAAADGDGEAFERLIVEAEEEEDEASEVDGQEIVGAIRKAVRVRLLRSFTTPSEERNKAILLEMARAGKRKPSMTSKDSDERRLGSALYTYMRPSRCDVEFTSEIRALRPDWFVDTVAENKATLLEMACAGKTKPQTNSEDSKERKLATALGSYTYPSSACYSVEFERAIRKAAPQWFVDPAIEKKKVLLEMARAGRPRPRLHSKDPEERKWANALGDYTRPSRSCCDIEFTREIRETAPHWFPVADKKKTLLEMARAGKPKPSTRSEDPEERKLADALGTRYMAPSSSCYDIEFEREIREAAPRWFPHRIAENKSKLLEMARAGKPKPSTTSKNEAERKLGRALSSYISPSSKCLDVEFARNIQEAAPRWLLGHASRRATAS